MLLLKDEESIVAQSTAQGAGAIAIIRISGVNAISVADSIGRLPGKKKLHNQSSHTIHYGWIVDDAGQDIDQVLFLLMKAPKTFTGQDVVEITCHNNQFLIEQIIDEAVKNGARLAESGEFTKRAVMHNKVDLLQAEAINELIHAQTGVALKQSLKQLKGSFSSWISKQEKKLLQIIALCEASFEFLDEEMTFDDQIKQLMDQSIEEVTTLLETFDKQKFIKEGIRIALVGSVNAGKSSLFNLLLNQSRAIVTDIAGTTRDTIEAGSYKKGSFVTFVDTAGLRDTADFVEKKGIDRSFEELVASDVILAVFDATKEYSQEEIDTYQKISDEYFDKIIFVQNKIDSGNRVLPFIQSQDMVSVSVLHKKNIDTLKETIDNKVARLMEINQSPCLLNKRQYHLLLTLHQELEKIKTSMKNMIEYELIAVDIKDAVARLSELTGKTVSEDVLDAVFKEFCVGK